MFNMPSMHMRTKILVLCLSCTLSALLLQTLFFQYSASSIIYGQERDASRKALESMQDELYGWIKSYENDLISIYNQTEFTRELGEGLEGRGRAMKYSRIAYNMALSAFDPAQNVCALYIYDIGNHLISYYRSASTPRYNYPDDLFQEPTRNNADIVARYVRSDNRVMLVSSYYNSSRRKDIIRFVLKIYTNNVSKKIGYIVCDVDPSCFLGIMAKYVYSDRQIVWLQPGGDRPALRFGHLEGEQTAYYGDAIKRIRNGTWATGNDGWIRGSVLFAIPQEKYNLTAYSLTPQYLLEASQRVLTRNMILIALTVVVVAVVSATLITRSLTTPLTRIAASLKEIQNGRTDLRLTGLGADEIGMLGHAINEMLDRIQELIAGEYAAQLLLKQSEYKALQAQVNPHFLYNTLETMSSVAASQQCRTVSNLCLAMSNIFRYSIDMKDPLATIAEEVVNIKNYMYVINVRTANSVELDIRIDRGLLGEKVPRLSLQPVVENALNHGLKDKHGEKRIIIGSALEGGDVLLTVSDNGVGMDADAVNGQLREADGKTLDRSSSIGLANIDARISLLFGKRYGVIVRSEPGAGSTVVIRIPRVSGEPETP